MKLLMTKLNFNDHKKNFSLLIIVLLTIVAYRAVVIGTIHSQRELPIEVDDAYVYISQSYLFYNDFNREGNTSQSVQSIAKKTLADDGSNNIQNVSRYSSWATYKGYFLYSSVFGYFTEILKIDPITVWWSFSYITQLLIALSIILTIKLYVKGDNLVFIIASALCAFISLEVVHQITATPFTIANALLLIGWWMVNQIERGHLICFGGTAIVFLALHVHPGSFVVLALLIGSSLCIRFFLKEASSFYATLCGIGAIILAVGIESLVVGMFHGERYLSLLGYQTPAIVRHNLSLYELVAFNYNETLERLNNFVSLMSTEAFALGKILYFLGLCVAYRLNKKILIVNIIFLLGVGLGLLHYVPYHKGELIEYVGQTQLIFIAIVFASLYACVVRFKKNAGLSLVMICVLMVSFSVQKYKLTMNQIDARANRHNFSNQISEMMRFVNGLPQERSLIVGDEFVYTMVLSQTTNRHIVFADHMRKTGVWSVPENHPKPAGYVGKPVKEVFVSGNSYKLANAEDDKEIIFSNIFKR